MQSSVSTRLTALIITLNEEEDLKGCLESVSFCDEVVVVDSGSTDQTVDIARSHGAKVISTTVWPGFGAQKQRALDAANSDWVLSLDADERISPKLRTEIVAAIHNPHEAGTNGFLINRTNFFLGRALKHGGWSPDYVLRLARRDKCKFDLAIVHERLLVNGTVKHLKESMIHLSYKTHDEILVKRLKYSRAGAEKLYANGRKCSGPAESIFRGTWTFIRHCFLQLGFLDGWFGLYAAYCKAKENQLKYRMLWALTRDGQSVK